MDWIFQANPKKYNLSAAIAEGSERNWAMNQHRDKVSVGDRVFFWESGAEAKLLAVGRVASPVYERNDSDFGRHAVDILYDYRVDPPLTREEILASPPPLGTYKPFAWLMGTNHLIHDSAVVKALDAAIQGRLVALATGLTSSAKLQESKIDLEQAIRNAKRETSHSLAEAIAEMDPIAFEWLVRAVLAELGYVNIVVTKPCDDGGVDLRARLVAKGVTSIETAVQVKRTASVGRPVVQNLRGSLTAHESGLLVTSGHFSVGAEAEAHEPTKVPIALVNGSKLVELLLEIGIGARQQTFKVYTLDPEALSLERLKERAIEVFAASDGD